MVLGWDMGVFLGCVLILLWMWWMGELWVLSCYFEMVEVSDFGLVLILLLVVVVFLFVCGVCLVVWVLIVVFELVFGIFVGLVVFGWVELGLLLEKLSDFGLVLLFFVVGIEIDFW